MTVISTSDSSCAAPPRKLSDTVSPIRCSPGVSSTCATRNPLFSLPSGKRQVYAAIAPSGSSEARPDKTNSSPGATTCGGPASAIGVAFTTTRMVSRSMFSGAPLSSRTTTATS